MKDKFCPSYNKNTEIERTEIGTANGEPIYKETEIILSESCSILNKIDDFDCTNCPVRKGLMKNEK